MKRECQRAGEREAGVPVARRGGAGGDADRPPDAVGALVAAPHRPVLHPLRLP